MSIYPTSTLSFPTVHCAHALIVIHCSNVQHMNINMVLLYKQCIRIIPCIFIHLQYWIIIHLHWSSLFINNICLFSNYPWSIHCWLPASSVFSQSEAESAGIVRRKQAEQWPSSTRMATQKFPVFDPVKIKEPSCCQHKKHTSVCIYLHLHYSNFQSFVLLIRLDRQSLTLAWNWDKSCNVVMTI